ncbi:MAG: hypothetical protein ABI388_11015 [Bacteroidia bacterium]
MKTIKLFAIVFCGIIAFTACNNPNQEDLDKNHSSIVGPDTSTIPQPNDTVARPVATPTNGEEVDMDKPHTLTPN